MNTSGAYTAIDVNPDRIFVQVSEGEKNEYVKWMENQASMDRGCFDDEGARLRLLRKRDLFSNVPCPIEQMIPYFGFIDSGYVMARSAQTLCKNPFFA